MLRKNIMILTKIEYLLDMLKANKEIEKQLSQKKEKNLKVKKFYINLYLKSNLKIDM